METTNNSIKCRKCGGPHLTIKCGKEVKVVEEVKDVKINDVNNYKSNNSNNYKSNNLNNSNNSNNSNKDYKSNNSNKDYDYKSNNSNKDYNVNKEFPKEKDCKVRIANLPIDMTKGELYNLLEDWGHIKSLFIKENYDSTSAFIEFETSEQSKYFVEAINETPFEYRIITAEIMTN